MKRDIGYLQIRLFYFRQTLINLLVIGGAGTAGHAATWRRALDHA